MTQLEYVRVEEKYIPLEKIKSQREPGSLFSQGSLVSRSVPTFLEVLICFAPAAIECCGQ